MDGYQHRDASSAKVPSSTTPAPEERRHDLRRRASQAAARHDDPTNTATDLKPCVVIYCPAISLYPPDAKGRAPAPEVGPLMAARVNAFSVGLRCPAGADDSPA